MWNNATTTTTETMMFASASSSSSSSSRKKSRRPWFCQMCRREEDDDRTGRGPCAEARLLDEKTLARREGDDERFPDPSIETTGRLNETLEVEDVTICVEKSARNEPIGGERQFSWTKQWYPVAVADMIDPLKPHPVTLLGTDLVVWYDSVGKKWNVFEDLLPA